MHQAAAPTPTFPELLRVFARIGCLSFGGPAGQIALMHRELIEERAWVSEADYLHALNFCHLLPGPEAQQLAIWIGWRLHGLRGGLAAGLLFVIPGALVILALSLLYVAAAGRGWFAALFLGIKAAVLALVVQALLRIAGRALDTGFKQAIAALAFAGLAVLTVPFPLVVVLAALAGAVAARAQPALLGLKPLPADVDLGPRPWAASLRAAGVGAVLWAAPMALVLASLGSDHVLWRVGVFFAKLATVSFGGAYAVLAYMAQQAVQTHHWLNAGEMADGLGLAETTPGPLIMVTQFVGFLAGYRHAAPFAPLVGGVLAAALTTWMTFAPCFLWIFAFAPWLERLRHAERLRGALAAITAAIVGVIGNLALWFALHVLFARATILTAGRLRFEVPDPLSLDWRATLLAVAAGVLIFRLRWSVPRVLGICAVGGLVLSGLG